SGPTSPATPAPRASPVKPAATWAGAPARSRHRPTGRATATTRATPPVRTAARTPRPRPPACRTVGGTGEARARERRTGPESGLAGPPAARAAGCSRHSSAAARPGRDDGPDGLRRGGGARPSRPAGGAPAAPGGVRLRRWDAPVVAGPVRFGLRAGVAGPRPLRHRRAPVRRPGSARADPPPRRHLPVHPADTPLPGGVPPDGHDTHLVPPHQRLTGTAPARLAAPAADRVR